MSIISINMLSARLPGSLSGSDLLKAVNRATSFVNTWTSNVYDPWDDFQASPELIQVPYVIEEITLEVGEAMYYLEIGQVQRYGNDQDLWQDLLDRKKEELMAIDVSPTWESQTISLDSNQRMVIGTRNSTTGRYQRVIPQNAEVVSSGSNVWNQGEDWYIRRGGEQTDEHFGAWYFDAQSSTLEGTLKYMRTYRKDTKDYMVYSRY